MNTLTLRSQTKVHEQWLMYYLAHNTKQDPIRQKPFAIETSLLSLYGIKKLIKNE